MTERRDALEALNGLRLLVATGALNSEQHPHANRDEVNRALDLVRASIDKAYPPPDDEDRDPVGDAIDQVAVLWSHRADAPHWSTTPPTEPGAYWFRCGGPARIVEVEMRDGHLGVETEPSGPGHFVWLEALVEDRPAEWWSERIQEPPR